MSSQNIFKKWLSIPDAVEQISHEIDQRIKESDLLIYALDGHLKLSVHFVNSVTAKPCEVIPRNNKSRLRQAAEKGVKNCIFIGEDMLLERKNEIVHLAGIYDLSMIGSEKKSVLQAYQDLIGGVPVNRTFEELTGAFVEDVDGQLFQLQSHLGDNSYLFNPDIKNPYYHPDNYYEVDLPTYIQVVIRTDELTVFVSRLNKKIIKPQDEEIESYFNTIKEKYNDSDIVAYLMNKKYPFPIMSIVDIGVRLGLEDESIFKPKREGAKEAFRQKMYRMFKKGKKKIEEL